MIVHQFLRWIETAPTGRRAEAADALARAFLFSEVEPEERKAMESAMIVLLDDPSPDVRFALADALANHEAAPRPVMLALAQDQRDTAALVLARSPLFLDAELVDALAGGEWSIQLAIASRRTVSPAVAAALAEVGEVAACRVLINNPGADIGRAGLRRLAERLGHDAELRELLLARPDLPADIRHTLVGKLGEALGELVSMRSWLDAGRAREVTREACERATVDIAAQSEPHELGRLADHLRLSGQLNATLLLRMLCTGNLGFFEAALSVLADMPEGRVARLVRGGRRGSLRAVCRKAGLPMRAFDAFAAAIEACREADWDEDGPEGRRQLEHRLAERVLEQYGENGGEAASDLLALLRRLTAESARAAAREYAASCVAAA